LPSLCRRVGSGTVLWPGRRREPFMPVPKRRTSKARKGKRRSHHALTPVQTVVCKQCGRPTLPHSVCSNCGWYRGRQVLEVEEE